MKRIIFILMAVLPIFTGCIGSVLKTGGIKYECSIDEVEAQDVIPQKGEIVKIPYSYAIVQTKFEPAEHWQAFRYRALIDGEVYTHAECPRADYTPEGAQYFEVVVPENDSYAERTVEIEVAISTDFYKIDWGEWRSVYTNTQAALGEGEPRRLTDLDSYGIRLVIDGISLDIDLQDNASVRCLKALLLDGDLQMNMYIANNLLSSDRATVEVLREHVPINQLDSKKLERGDIYLMSYGCINIYNEVNSKGTKIGETYIGRISSATMSNLDKICYDNKYLFPDTYPMRMTLVR